MYTNSPIPTAGIFRAVVTHSSSANGVIKVKIPAVIGVSIDVSISYIGRAKQSNNLWSVPAVGSQIVVCADDADFTNLFWIQTDGVSQILTRLATLEQQVSQHLQG